MTTIQGKGENNLCIFIINKKFKEEIRYIKILGLDIHFYHEKPNLPNNKNLKVLPLLMLHGWPGSVVEFQKIIPMLTKPWPNQNFVFEVIVPSLPGYGFSEGAVRPGMANAQVILHFLQT